MGFWGRFKKPNWSETRASLGRAKESLSRAFSGGWASTREGMGSRFARMRDSLSSSFAKLRRKKSDQPLLSDQLPEDAPIAPPEKSAFRNFSENLKGKFQASLANFKEKLPRDLNDLKPDELMDRARQLFSSGASATYIRLGAAAIAAYFMADTVSLFTDALIPDPPPVPAPRVARKAEQTRSVDEYSAILSRNIFNSQGLIPEPENMATGPARKTNLPLVLVGTVVLKDELKSMAAIEDKSQNMVFPVRVDDTIDDKVQIKKIERFKVFFINKSSGFMEYVEIVDDYPMLNTRAAEPTAPQPKRSNEGITQHGENNYELDRTVVDKAVGNLSQVLQQARAIPNFEQGMPDGYKIIQIVPGSIYDKLGIKNGDVICGINNEPINDPGKAFQFFNQLKSARNIEICVKRGGRRMTMNYDIR